MADPVYIQTAISANPSAAAATTISVAYSTANLTAGSALWCYCTWGSNDRTPTCADSVNGAWSVGPKLYDSVNAQGVASFYLKNTAGGAKPTVTVTFGGSQDYRGLHIFEIGPADTTTQPAGTAPAINLQNAPGTGANAVISGNIDTTGNANALIVGFTCDINGLAQPSAGTAPLTWVGRGGWTASAPSRAEDATLATGGVTQAKFTAVNGGSRFLTGVMAFKAAAAAAVSITPTIGSLSASGVASRNDRGIFVPTEVDP